MKQREIIVVLLLCPLLLAGCFNAPFLSYDDAAHVALPVVRGVEPWYNAFEPKYGTCFPLTILSFRLEVLIYKTLLNVTNWAPLARLDNLLLHASAGYCVWLICKALRAGRSAALLVAGAFLLHPMACESVAWVSERKNVLAAAFGFGALALQLYWANRRWRILAAAGLYALAALSKPSAVGLLPVLLAVDLKSVRAILCGVGGEGEDIPINRWRVVGWMLLIASGAFSAGFNLYAHFDGLMPPPGGSFYTGLLADAEILRRYMQNLILPTQLSIYYAAAPVQSALDPRFLLNVLVVAAVVAGSILLSKRRGLSVFLWFWFFSALAPVLNLVSITIVMQDRFVYLSTPAFFLALALAVEGAAERLVPLTEVQTARLGILAVWGFVLALGAQAAFRSQAWDNVYELFHDAVVKQPQSAWAQMYYGQTLAKNADMLELKPDLSGLGVNSIDMEKLRMEALYHLNLAMRTADFVRLPTPSAPYILSAYIQQKRGKMDEAEALARIVLEDDKAKREIKMLAHERLASIMVDTQRPEEALVHCRQALFVWPTSPHAWFYAGRALEALHRPEAAAAYAEVRADSAEYADAQKRIAAIQGAAGR